MDIVIALVVGSLCGVAQFFVMRYTLKPLTDGKKLNVGKAFLLRMPIPIILLLCCALIDTNLLPFAGGAFCLSQVTASVINLMSTSKKG